MTDQFRPIWVNWIVTYNVGCKTGLLVATAMTEGHAILLVKEKIGWPINFEVVDCKIYE